MTVPAEEVGPPAHVRVDVVGGRARLTRLDHSAYLSPRLLRVEGVRACVALVATRATLLAGDHVRLDVELGPGSVLELCEPAATVAYNARGGHARWSARVRADAGARLVWAAAPLVVAAGAAVDRDARVDLHEGATALLRDCVVLGRGGEPEGGALQTFLRADLDGAPLLREHLDLRDPCTRSAPGILGGRRVLATAVLLGALPPPAEGPREPGEAYETPLAGPGSLARALGQHAHDTVGSLDPVWRRWGSVGSVRPAVNG